MRRPTTIEFVGGPKDGEIHTVDDGTWGMSVVHGIACQCPGMPHQELCQHDWQMELGPGTHTRLKWPGLMGASRQVLAACTTFPDLDDVEWL